MSLSLPPQLRALIRQNAISKVVYSAISGFDHNDSSLLQAACTEDATITLHPGARSFRGVDEILNNILSNVGPLDSTHMMSNVRVESDKEDSGSAHLIAYVLAQHCPQGRGREASGPKYLTAGEHHIRLVAAEKGADNLEETWKIKDWVVNIIWAEGDDWVVSRDVVAKPANGGRG